MSAPARVSGELIREALRAAHGNVTAAAARVGIAPVNLRKRLPRLGVDLAELRGKESRRSVRVSAELFARLRDAKFDLQHKLRREMDEGDVLAAFAEEAFEAWLEQRLARP